MAGLIRLSDSIEHAAPPQRFRISYKPRHLDAAFIVENLHASQILDRVQSHRLRCPITEILRTIESDADWSVFEKDPVGWYRKEKVNYTDADEKDALRSIMTLLSTTQNMTTEDGTPIFNTNGEEEPRSSTVTQTIDSSRAPIPPPAYIQDMRCCKNISSLAEYLRKADTNQDGKRRRTDYRQISGPAVFRKIKEFFKTEEGRAHLIRCDLDPQNYHLDHAFPHCEGGPSHFHNAYLMPPDANTYFRNEWNEEKRSYIGVAQRNATRQLMKFLRDNAVFWPDEG